MASRLQNPIVASNRFDHRATIRNRERERFFAVDILARLQRHHRDHAVPMIRDNNDHGIQVIMLEQLSKIRVRRAIDCLPGLVALRRLRIDHRFGRLATIEMLRLFVARAAFVDIANGEHVAEVGGQESLQQAHTLVARTNEPDVDSVTRCFGREHRRTHDQRCSDGGGVLEELATIFHGSIPTWFERAGLAIAKSDHSLRPVHAATGLCFTAMMVAVRPPRGTPHHRRAATISGLKQRKAGRVRHGSSCPARPLKRCRKRRWPGLVLANQLGISCQDKSWPVLAYDKQLGSVAAMPSRRVDFGSRSPRLFSCRRSLRSTPFAFPRVEPHGTPSRESDGLQRDRFLSS